ncbi:putative reverse transcriptase domain-containing protein [Tanacetum coccineum]
MLYNDLIGTPPLLPISLPAPSTSLRANIPEADTPPRKRLLLTAPTPRVKTPWIPGFEILRGGLWRPRVGQPEGQLLESNETHQSWARSEAYSKALEAQIRVLETQAYRHEWQHQDADDRAIEHIIRTQTLEAGARVYTLEYTGHKGFWAHAVGPNNKKYAGSLPLCNKCKCHHNGSCTVKFGNWKKKYTGTLPLYTKCNYHHKGQCAPKCNICKKIGHLAQNCRTPVAAEYQRTLTCYECGGLRHYKRDCPELKNQNHGNQAGSMEARGVVHAFSGGETKQDLNNIEYEIEA